jgi:hypothetical protein
MSPLCQCEMTLPADFPGVFGVTVRLFTRARRDTKPAFLASGKTPLLISGSLNSGDREWRGYCMDGRATCHAFAELVPLTEKICREWLTRMVKVCFGREGWAARPTRVHISTLE